MWLSVACVNSGITALDDWLRRRARPNEAEGASRTFVTCSGQRVVGYFDAVKANLSTYRRARLDVTSAFPPKQTLCRSPNVHVRPLATLQRHFAQQEKHRAFSAAPVTNFRCHTRSARSSKRYADTGVHRFVQKPAWQKPFQPRGRCSAGTFSWGLSVGSMPTFLHLSLIHI